MKRLAFLGPRGTFTEQAALLHEGSAELTPYPSNGSIVFAVRDGLADEGIAPIENSLEGPVTETLDALLQSETVSVSREIVLAVEQCLIAAPGTRLQDIEVVMSHPQALGQCRHFLETTLPAARLEAALSTAGAVETAVATKGAAAIGTRRAAELVGGEVLAAAVQDVKQNKTRFVVLSRQDAGPTGDDKTSIAFTVAHDQPGTLMGVLAELSKRGINLTHIESRPSREELGIYVFLIDFQGHRSDPVVADALEAIRSQAYYFRLFGSYPRFSA